MAEATEDPVRLPAVAPIPKPMAAAAFMVAGGFAVKALGRHYGPAFCVKMPVFGAALVLGDPVLIKDLFATRADLVGRLSNLGSVLGPGSTFSLHGSRHRQRRRLLMPSFQGRRMSGYEVIVEEEVLREIATWPEGREFATLPSMMRITLNAILRTVFGAEGAELDELRRLLPPMVSLGSRLAMLPVSARRDLGRLSPGGRFAELRRRYDAVIADLIANARRDPDFAERGDVLSLLLAARYDDDRPISDAHVADELLTLLAAGHETTATTLAWAIERLRRHPALLRRLTAEIDSQVDTQVGAAESRLLQAVVWEVQRTHPVIEGTARLTNARIRLGEWVIPERTVIIASTVLAHSADRSFPDAEVFDPDRFIDRAPDASLWVPFGGGVHRCIGAPFANMEMLVVLRTLLRHFAFESTSASGEVRHSRGVATAPGRGGRAVVYRRGTSTTAAVAQHC